MPTTNYLCRLLDPVLDSLPPETLQVIIDIRADAETEIKLERLRESASEGTLTAAEEANYREFVEAVDVISILQSKARSRLTRNR